MPLTAVGFILRSLVTPKGKGTPLSQSLRAGPDGPCLNHVPIPEPAWVTVQLELEGWSAPTTPYHSTGAERGGAVVPERKSRLHSQKWCWAGPAHRSGSGGGDGVLVAAGVPEVMLERKHP